jgi:cytochrome c-type protein NapC
MFILHKTVCRIAATVSIAMLPAASALAVDWAKVPGKDLVLTYPGQTSWEWVLTKNDHEGAEKFRGGKACKECHDDEALAKDGAKVAKGGKLEPSPIAGKPGSLPVTVQAAHDGTRLYFRLSWKETGAIGSTQEPKYAARASVFLSDATVKEAVRAGCWGACHEDVEGMPAAGASPQDKYLGASRTKLGRSGGGANLKPQAELDSLLAGGTFIEFWSAALNPGQPAAATNGYILDARHEAATPTVAAEASFDSGTWTVVLSRPLAGAGPGEKSFASGNAYPLGIAIHDSHAKGRWHYVSMEQSLALDGKGDVVANKQ